MVAGLLPRRNTSTTRPSRWPSARSDHRHRPHLGRQQADGHDRRYLALVSGRRFPDPRSLHRRNDGGRNTPAYRGTAYVVFEDLARRAMATACRSSPSKCSARWPNPTPPRGWSRQDAVPGGEFSFATQAIRSGTSGETAPENLTALPDTPEHLVTLDQLQAMVPGGGERTLVVPWFGDDLRAGVCELKPGVEAHRRPPHRFHGL